MKVVKNDTMREAFDLFPDNKPITVLLVSQPGIMHNVLHSILQSVSSATVLDANGAFTAYALLETQPVDVIVIDANIPFAESQALITRIKNNFPHIQCLAFTATAKEKRLLQSAGADKILFQDCSLQEIEDAVFS